MSEIEMRAAFEDFAAMHALSGHQRTHAEWAFALGVKAGRLKGLEEAAQAIDIGGAAPGRSFARDIRELIDKEPT